METTTRPYANLTLNDYIILIDKFKLDTTDLSRNNIVNLVEFLNTQSNQGKQFNNYCWEKTLMIV